MNNIKVSICVPVYGVEKYIEKCAISLFEQTYPNIEYIFVNDNTPDKSIEILESVIERYPNRKPYVRIIAHEKNRGLAAARNTAVDAVTTEFLMHVDSDDWVENDIVEKCVKKQLEGNYDIVSIDIIKEYAKLSEHIILPNFINSKDMTIKLLNGKSFHSIYGHLIRTSLYNDNNIRLEEGLNMGEDYLIIPKLSYFANNVINLHEFLYHYNSQNINSYVNSFSISEAEQSWEVSKKLKQFFYDKGESYINSIYIADADKISLYLRVSLKNHNAAFYNAMCEKLNMIDKKYIKAVPLFSRILLYLKYKPLRIIYFKIASYFRSFYRFKIVPLLSKK